MSQSTPPPTDPPIPPPPDSQPDLQSTLAAAQHELATLKASLAATERRHALDLALLAAGAIDPESAAVIAASIPDSATTDPTKLVTDLKRRKPFLFAHPRPGASAAAPMTPDHAPVEAAAAHARATGDRRSLLHYLRLRRQSPS